MRSVPTLVCVCLAVPFSSCSSDLGPSEAELRESLGVELPPFVSVKSLEIEASQNFGNEIDPIYKTRFRAKLQVNSDTFAKHERDGSVLFVRPVKNRGYVIEVFGKSRSQLYAGKWRTVTRLDPAPGAKLGVPLSMFSASRVIVIGSEEEQEYREEIERIAEEKRHLVLAAFSGTQTLPGEAKQPGNIRPFRLRVTSLDQLTGKWSGEIEWITLGAVHRVDGTLSGTQVTFKETEFIKKGDAMLGWVYILDLDDSETRLVGIWKIVAEGRDLGEVWIGLAFSSMNPSIQR